ncbi:hypothetical protein P5Y53_02070 [Dyella jiangningensis]|uniref:hypothetical protein n=1 Tax=Dyella jiangningensis TaxID=1379159 RepID=UPI00240F44F8|nr:hypothetical protein [Dyella jiangningensis]MDG2536445.1 hypothetical protein [Dyella jiangningensis]
MKPVACMIGLGTLLLAGGPWMVGAQAQEMVAPAIVPAAAEPSALAHVVSGIPTSDDLAGWTPVSQDTLDDARGGYDLGNGLMASFGIDRAVYVNGNLVTSTSFNVPDIAHMTPAQATAMQSALNTVTVTQIGPNNTFDPSSIGQNAGATVIQNTLNGQHIQSITTINTSVNSLNVFRQANFQDALQQAQLQAIGH